MKILKILTSLFILGFIISCNCNKKEKLEANIKVNTKENTALFKATLQKHLHAVANKDSVTLLSTMSPTGEMQLILPGSEIIHSVDSFMDYHTAWFKDTTTVWTFETNILTTEIDKNLGIATTEIIYKEKERNGKPYFNRMIVTYALKKINNTWYIVKDHASSIEKSTDK